MGTGLKIFGAILLFGVFGVIISITFGTCNTVSKMVDDGQQTVYDEYKPSELLKKYSWFKDASANLDAKIANLAVYHKRLTDLADQYKNISRSSWPREDREQYSQWQTEEDGILSSYNDLAAEYNSSMAKFNWRFCNKGTLPQGAEIPLPRDYKPYQYSIK